MSAILFRSFSLLVHKDNTIIGLSYLLTLRITQKSVVRCRLMFFK